MSATRTGCPSGHPRDTVEGIADGAADERVRTILNGPAVSP
jgi:hypothetical protein